MKSLVLASLTACGLASTPALAQQAKPFGSTAVPCNSAEQMTNCRVSYDGASTVIRTFKHARGGQTTVTFSGCTSQGRRITCPPGHWSTDKGFSGSTDGAFTVNLNGSGRPSSTGH